MIKIEAKRVKHLLDAIGYRKRSAYIIPREKVRLTGINWSGGSRSEYFSVTLEGKPISDLRQYQNCHPLSNPAEGAEVPIPPGACLIQAGTFCGKPATAYIYVNPTDMPKVLS